MSPRAATRGALLALAALAAAGAPARPASADVLPDNYPTPQAVLAHAEFLAQVPAPPSGAGTVCVIDTGVTPLPDLAGQIVERIAIDGGSGDDIRHHADDPFSGHGSFVAGTIASQVDGVGSAGIWPAAKIISVRVFRDATGGATSADYRTAISECEQYGVQVITISLGTSASGLEDLAKLEDRIVTARNIYGINIVASAGNDGNTAQVDFPARFPASFAVGATDQEGSLCAFSNSGSGLDISALGCSVHVSGFGGQVEAVEGTSFAAPTIAGILAALRAYSGLSADASEQLLMRTARHTPAGLMIDAAAAFRLAGLGDLVDAYRPPSRPSTGVSSQIVTKVTVSLTPAVESRVPASPKLRVALFRRGVVTVHLAQVPHGGEAVFRIGERSYVRLSGRLSVKARHWRPVSVLVENEWGLRSAPLTIKSPSASRGPSPK